MRVRYVVKDTARSLRRNTIAITLSRTVVCSKMKRLFACDQEHEDMAVFCRGAQTD